MHDFELVRASELAGARAALEGTDEARLIAGGQTLVPSMKHGLVRPSRLVDLARIPGLRGISATEAGLRIGAMTTHAEVAASPEVCQRLPALASLAEGIGDRMVRNLGTLGGSVANNDPAADYPAAVVALGATVVTDRRSIAADDFFTGMFSTALEPSEIVVAIEFPIPRRAGYSKFRNPASRYAITGVFVAQFADAVRVAVTGAAGCVFRFGAMEAALARSFTPLATEAVTLAVDDLISDIHASPEYRANLAVVVSSRAVEQALWQR
jgi:aerobic carbon-monoxide dehydrogenase medium subunit